MQSREQIAAEIEARYGTRREEIAEEVRENLDPEIYDAAEIEAEIDEQYKRWLDEEIDEIIEKREAEAEREAAREAEYQDWLARGEAVRRCVIAARSAVPGLVFTGNDSLYATYRGRIKIRIADHSAPDGAGWNERTQDRHQKPDVNFVVAANRDFDRAEIRARIAKALWFARHN